MAEYVDYGALWLAENLEDFHGKIYDKQIALHRNPRKEAGDKFPDWRIVDPSVSPPADLGALWVKASKRDGTEFLGGEITLDGLKRQVSLWPAKRNSAKSPHWRVMPPREDPEPPSQQMPTDGEEIDDSVPF